MARNTSITLGEHFDGFIAAKIKEGRFESKSEAVRAAMRLLEEHEQKVEVIKNALIVGEAQIARGEYVALDGREDIQHFFSALGSKRRSDKKCL